MKFFKMFKKKDNVKVQECIDARIESTKKKIEAADKLIEAVDSMQLEKRCGIIEYHGPERRAHA